MLAMPAPVAAQDISGVGEEVIITGSRTPPPGRRPRPVSQLSFADLVLSGAVGPNFFFPAFSQTLNVDHTENIGLSFGTPIGSVSGGTVPLLRFDLSHIRFSYDGHTNSNGAVGPSSGNGNLTYAGIGPGIATRLGDRLRWENSLTLGGAFGGISGTFEADISGFAALGRSAVIYDLGNASSIGLAGSVFQVFGDHDGGVTGGVRSPFRQDSPSVQIELFYRHYFSRRN